jgi:signal transduction histidine kinase
MDLKAELSLLEQAGVSAHALRALSERLEQMREEERTRISRELHDELGQLLTCIKLDFVATVRRLRELKTPGDVVDRLQSAVGQIDLGIAMVRRIATGLRPPGLDHRDLDGAIGYEARRMSAIAGVRMPVTARIGHPVGTEVATAAFRVFEEALTNAVRHAQATCISTTVCTTGRGRLLLYISDDGVGISRARLERGASLGLLGMSERARKLGGTLRVTSRAGQGTRVLLALPLDRDSAFGIRDPGAETLTAAGAEVGTGRPAPLDARPSPDPARRPAPLARNVEPPR